MEGINIRLPSNDATQFPSKGFFPFSRKIVELSSFRGERVLSSDLREEEVKLALQKSRHYRNMNDRAFLHYLRQEARKKPDVA